MSIGGELFKGSSGLLSQPLGIVKIGFRGYDMGKTTAGSMLAPDEDIKDIIFQQDGTKSADTVRTGILYKLTCTFGEINTGLLVQLMAGLTSENHDPAEDSATIGRNMYQSMRDNEAGVLQIASVDANGVASDLPEDIISVYEAVPKLTSHILNWEADSQRNVVVEFNIYYHIFATGESTTKVGAFGYWGDPTVEDVPAVVVPDVAAPYVLSAVVDTATQITVTMSEDVSLVAAVALVDRIVATVDRDFNVPLTAVIEADPNDDTLTLTFGAATFAAGNVVKLFLSESTLQDVDLNQNSILNAFTVTNPL